MSLPASIQLDEVGPREGFQFEGIGRPEAIATADKIRLIDALAGTGLRTIEIASFVHPAQVPQMADAEAVCAGVAPRQDVAFVGIYLNDVGLRRAIATGKLAIAGKISLTASEAFALRNQKRSLAQDIEMQRRMAAVYREHGYRVETGSIMAAFGCNYEGPVPLARVLDLVARMDAIAGESGGRLGQICLADTMGWANPELVRRTVGAVRERWPALRVKLHLHDTRGLGIANVHAGLSEGVDRFDTAVAGLGGCPFAGHRAAAGNVCSEEVVFLCRELGIETGVDLDRLVECGLLAESIVGHPLPSKLLRSGTRPRGSQAAA